MWKLEKLILLKDSWGNCKNLEERRSLEDSLENHGNLKNFRKNHFNLEKLEEFPLQYRTNSVESIHFSRTIFQSKQRNSIDRDMVIHGEFPYTRVA